MADDLIGTGLTSVFVLEDRSSIELLSGAALIDNSIVTLINTEAANSDSRLGGDRVYNRGIGLNFAQFLFKSDDLDLRTSLINEVNKLPLFEPRIEILNTNVFSDQERSPAGFTPGLLILEITYRIVITSEIRNLIIPILTKDRFFQIVVADVRSEQVSLS
jgi:phage baseplate assembly protein W